FLHKPVTVRVVPCSEVIMLYLTEGAVEIDLVGESTVASRGMGDYAGNGNFVHWLTVEDFGVNILKCWHSNFINKGDVRDYEYSISVEITKEEVAFEIKNLVPCESVSMKLLHGAKGVREIGS
ncbi:MAG: hypothetical protein LBM93_12855, partial [Oscillospiraceae bacterium]|nr:hypothetical protein [Oscillospiraceae bacterium]